MGDHDYAIDQAHTVRAARIGDVACVAVDATSHIIDLSKLGLGGVQGPNIGRRNHVYISLEADGNDIYYAFDIANSTATISDTAAASAGGPFVLDARSVASPQSSPTNAQCARLIAGVPADVYLDRQVDGVIIVKCASGKSATLRIWVSSQNSPGA